MFISFDVHVFMIITSDYVLGPWSKLPILCPCKLSHLFVTTPMYEYLLKRSSKR